MVCNTVGGLNQFVTIENDSPFLKAYIRAQITDERTKNDLSNLILLYSTYYKEVLDNNTATIPANTITPLTSIDIEPGIYFIEYAATFHMATNYPNSLVEIRLGPSLDVLTIGFTRFSFQRLVVNENRTVKIAASTYRKITQPDTIYLNCRHNSNNQSLTCDGIGLRLLKI